MSLRDYLDVFNEGDLAATAQPLQSGLSRQTVASLQNILIGLGWRSTTIPRPGAKDFGLFGPKTAGAWAQSAGSRKLNPTFQRASATEAFVDPTTLAALAAQSQPVPTTTAAAPRTSTPATRTAPAPTSSALVNASAADLYTILYSLGWTTKKLPKSSVYTAALAKSWATSATTRKLNTVLQPTAYADSVLVDPKTLAALQADARSNIVQKGAPAAEKVVPGTVTKPVLELQNLLYGVGWTAKKLARDGKYGPQTKNAWGVSAKLRKLPVLFERVDGQTARVSQATYDKIAADAKVSPAAPVSTPAAAPVATKSTIPAADTTDKSVADVQNVLIRLGWRSTTIPRPGAKDFGLFGPKTQGAWESSTKKRKLNPMFVRVDGKTARVNTQAYVAMLEESLKKAPVETTKPTPQGPKGPIGGNTPTPEWARTESTPGTALISVFEMQDIVHRLGVTKTKATSDGKFGPSTQKAWESVAAARKLNAGVTGKLNATKVLVVADTYSALKNEAGGKVAAPSTLDTEIVNVDTVQQGLNVLASSKLKVDGKWGPKTENALRGWLNKQPGGKAVKIVRSANKVKLPSALAAVLRQASQNAPAPKPTTSQDQALVDAILKRATVTEPVLAVQRMLDIARRAKPDLPQVALSGQWDGPTQEAFLLFLVQSPDIRPAFRMALPKLVSPDNTTIRVWPDMQAPIETGNKLWLSQPAPAPAQLPVQGPVATPMAPVTNDGGGAMVPSAPTAAPAPSGGGGGGAPPSYVSASSGSAPGGGDGGGGGEATPGGGGAPAPTPETPAPGAPAASSDPGSAWDSLVGALDSLGNDGPKYIGAVQAAISTGGKLRPEVEKAFEDWASAAERVKQRVAQIISDNPQVASAMDAASANTAPVSGPMSGLEAYFGELASASSDALDLLRSPFGVSAAAAAPMHGFEQAIQIAEAAAPWVARFAGIAWRSTIQLLKLPVVRQAVVTGVAVKGIGDAVNQDANNYKDTNQQLNQLVSEGKLTVEQAGSLKEDKPINPWLLLGGGVVLVGGVAVYYKNKKKVSEGRHAR